VPNNIERFSPHARQALILAQEEAERMQLTWVGTEHLLFGLLREADGVAGRALRGLGLEEPHVRELIGQMTRAKPRAANGSLELSPDIKKVLEQAVDEAHRLGDNGIDTEHLLLSLVGQSDSAAIDILKKLSISPEDVRKAVHEALEKGK
jgi:ATP-dependent Clp protease ATP-binding subunit ClpC